MPRQAQKGVFHGVDHPEFMYKIFRDVTKWLVVAHKVEDIPRIFAQAFSVASSGRPGPVHLELPVDLLQREPTQVVSYGSEPSKRILPDSRLVDEVTEVLLAARAPVVCAGKGIRASAATAELATLAELLAAPVVFPADAIGAFPAVHRLCAGAFGSFLPNPFPLQLVKESDVLLVTGMCPGTTSAEILDTCAPQKYIFLSPDEEINNADRASLSAVVDCKAMLTETIARIGAAKKVPDREIDERIAEAKEVIGTGLDEAVERYRGHKPIHFRLALKELVPLLDQDAIVVGDVGNHGVWTSKWFEVHGTQNLILPGSWGAMGFALPGAIAAKLVHPERQVIGVTGDSAFLMSCSDFGTALEVDASAVIVVLNDSRYGMIHKLQIREFGRTYGTELRSPDFAEFAESFGAVGIRVEDDSELRSVLNKALTADSPVIVDVVSGHDFPYPSLDE